MIVRTRIGLSHLSIAIALCLALAAAGCGDDSPVATPDTTPVTTSIPTPPEDAGLDDCGLASGPIDMEGLLARVTGGIAGIDETTFVPSTCAADPIPVLGADWDGIEVVEAATDCEDCADAMSGATSEPVEVRGQLRPADEVMAELARGETLATGDLVLLATSITPIP